ncbi:unnamed protein product [Trichobilharzia szidati]|nr:unnamed protein product [Trichobilharzia szidati]
MKKESKVDFKPPPTIMTSTIPSNNEDQHQPLKHLTNNYDVHHHHHTTTTTSTNNERKLKTRIESFSKMNSIQETSDYDANMKLPRFMTNYKYKQAKYLLNLTPNKYKKRKPFNYIDSTLYKTHWNYSSYYNENETNENYATTYRPYNYYYYYNYNNSSSSNSHSRSAYSNIYNKRSDYGRFKRSKDSGPSLADVPMNVDFNTASPTYTSNRFHVFSYEQVKQLDAIMNSCVCIAPKPLFSSCIDENNNSLSMNKACYCCYLQESIMNCMKNGDDIDISGLTINPICNLSQNKKTSGEMTDTTIGTTTTETPSTTPTKNTPSISNNLKTSTFSDQLFNEDNFITHASNSPDLSSTCYHDACLNLPSSHTPLMPEIFPTTRLPTIRIQLKKLIRTIRDRLVEESIPVKEIRLGGGAACSIVGSQKTEKFNDIDLIFRVDLSNSTTFTKIKSIVFSCIAHILADTIALEKLKHYSYGCPYMCNNNNTFPLPHIHSTETTPQNSLTSSCCCNCTCSPLNKSFQLNKENIGNLQTTPDAPKGNKHKYNNNNNDNRQPLHENSQSNGGYQSNSITEENSFDPGTCPQSNNNNSLTNENQTENCNSTCCGVCHPLTSLYPYYAFDSFLPPVACSMCSRQFSCSYYNNIDCINNTNNNNGNNSNCLMNPYNDTTVKQYIQKMIRIFKPNSKISDSWSLFTIGYRGRGCSSKEDNATKIIDMKFIDRMHRQFEFTVDSFQIVLDSLIKFHDPTSGYLQHQQMNENFYPTVVAESLSGSYVEAVAHLNDRIIATYRPEEIHGGGLLKYCKLLAEGYKQSETTDVMSMEKYMCSRFFIDFPDIISQHNQINAFLLNQFERDSKKKANYLNILYEVVSNSTICLMTHERRQTLCLIQMFLRDVIEEDQEQQQQQQQLRQQQNQQKQDNNKQSIVHLQEFSSNDWALDKVFYGTNYFPRQMYQVADKSNKLSNSDEKCEKTIKSDKPVTSTSKTTGLKVKLQRVQEEEHDKDNNDDDNNNNGEESDEQTDKMNTAHKDNGDPTENNNVIINSTDQVDNENKDDDNDDGVDGVDDDDDDNDDDDDGSHSASVDSLSKNSSSECTCHLHYPLLHRYPPYYYHHHYHYHHLLSHHLHQHQQQQQYNRHHCCHHYPHQHLIHPLPLPPPPPHHHHPVYNGDMYYYPQLVTYFPANDYLLSPSMIKNQAYYSLPYDTTIYSNHTDNNNDSNDSAHLLPNSLPHYHAKIILPQETKSQERRCLDNNNNNDMRHYVGVPCTYPSSSSSMIYPKFQTDTTTATATATPTATTDNGNSSCSNSSSDTQMIQTYCEPLIFYSPTDQNYYLCPTTSLHEVQESLPVVYNYTPI